MGLWCSIQSFLRTVLVFTDMWKYDKILVKNNDLKCKVDVENFDGLNNFGLW